MSNIAIDWDKYMTGLSGKSNTDLDNISEKGLAVIKAHGVPSTADYVVERKVNPDGSWYRKYKSGWLEQGGITPKMIRTNNYDSITITFLKPYQNETNITINLTQYNQGETLGTAEATNGNAVHKVTKTNFIINSFAWAYKRYWYACGQS